jgi:hypothetical protein
VKIDGIKRSPLTSRRAAWCDEMEAVAEAIAKLSWGL